jgi:Flp pilus assembly protein TadD
LGALLAARYTTGAKHVRDEAKLKITEMGTSRSGRQRRRPADGFDRLDRFIAAGLAIATLAVYGQVAGHQFIVFDDQVYIQNNPMVTGGLTWNGVAWAFTTFYDSNWHPLAWIAHMVDVQLFGLNAGRHLLVNALIHVANTWLLFLFLRRVTHARWPSAIVAALFALHPLHVESVAWAIERKDTLSTFFGLLTLLAYVRYAKAPSATRYALVALWLGLGLMAKPMLVTWPFVLLVLDYWPLRRVEWRPADGIERFARAWLPLVREKLPLFGMVAASMVVTWFAQGDVGPAERIVDAPLTLRVANALVSYSQYIFLTFWPADLAVYYPFLPAGPPTWRIAVAVIMLAAITVTALRGAVTRPWLIVGWLWFVGTFIPVIGLVPVGIGQAMADRYYYVPSIGLYVALVFGLAELASRWRIGRGPIIAVAAAALVLLSSVTAVQASRWRDTDTLLQHTLSVTGDNLVAEYNYGYALMQRGEYERAIPHFAEALRIEPNFFAALLYMALSLEQQGRPGEAISYYERALAVQSTPEVRTNLGLALAREGRFPEAVTQLNEVVRLTPNSAEAHNNLGGVLLMAGQPEKSVSYLRTALRLNPGLAAARDNLQRAQLAIDAESR